MPPSKKEGCQQHKKGKISQKQSFKPQRPHAKACQKQSASKESKSSTMGWKCSKFSEKHLSLSPDRPHAEACAQVRRSTSTAKLRQWKRKWENIGWNLSFVWSLHTAQALNLISKDCFAASKRQIKGNKQRGFQFECSPKQWVRPLLLVFTGFQARLHARPINLSSPNKSPKCPKRYFSCHIFSLYIHKHSNTRTLIWPKKIYFGFFTRMSQCPTCPDPPPPARPWKLSLRPWKPLACQESCHDGPSWGRHVHINVHFLTPRWSWSQVLNLMCC